jgi:hypothetical protein
MGVRTGSLDMIAAMRREAADRAKREEAARVVERWNKAIAAGRDMWGRRRDAEGGRAIGGQSMNGAVPALLSQIGAEQRRGHRIAVADSRPHARHPRRPR